MNISFFAKTKVKLFLCFALAVILTIILHSRETDVRPEPRLLGNAQLVRDVETLDSRLENGSRNFRLENTKKSFSDIFGMDDISGRVKTSIF